MGILEDNPSIKDLNELQDGQYENAVIFTVKGDTVPGTISALWYELERGEEHFKFNSSLVTTDTDLSSASYIPGTLYKRVPAKDCTVLHAHHVVFNIKPKRMSLYVFFIPEGDMIYMLHLCRKDGRKDKTLEQLKLDRATGYSVHGFDDPIYIRKEVRIAIGKEVNLWEKK